MNDTSSPFLTCHRKRVLFTLIAITFIDYMSVGLVYPLFSSLIFDENARFLPKGSSYVLRGFVLGMLFSLMPLVQFFSAPILGAFSDFRGRKGVLIAALVIGVIAYCLAVAGVHFEDLTLLIISRMLLGIAGGSAAVVQAVFSDISTEEEKTHLFSLFNMALGTGLSIGPFIGGKFSDPSLVSFGCYALPFWIAACMMLLNLFFVCFFLEETKKERSKMAISMNIGLKNLCQALRLPRLRLLFFCAFIFTFGWSFFIEFVPVYLIGKYRFSASDVGNFYAYCSFCYAISCGIFIRPFISYLENPHILFSTFLSTSLYLCLFFFIQKSSYLWLYFPFLLFLIALIFPTLTSRVSIEGTAEEQGKILGILQSVQSMAFASAPLFSGPLIGVFIHMPVLVGALSIGIAALSYGYFFRSAPKVEENLSSEVGDL